MNTEWTGDNVNHWIDNKLGLDRLVFWPNSVLNAKCEEVTIFDDKLLEIVDNMKQTMGSAEGIGIAAPQIGILKKIICIAADGQYINLANPHITPIGTEETLSQEGCLSFPGIYIKVKRFKEVALTGQEIERAENRLGKLVTYSLSGLAAICAQHETDHINGITMVDHLSKLKRDIIRAKIAKTDKRAL